MNPNILEALRKLSEEQYRALLRHGAGVLDKLTVEIVEWIQTLSPTQIENAKDILGSLGTQILKQVASTEDVTLEYSEPAYQFNRTDKVKFTVLMLLLSVCSALLCIKDTQVQMFTLMVFFPVLTELIYVSYDKFFAPEYDTNTEIKNGNIAVSISAALWRLVIFCGILGGYAFVYNFTPKSEGAVDYEPPKQEVIQHDSSTTEAPVQTTPQGANSSNNDKAVPSKEN